MYSFFKNSSALNAARDCFMLWRCTVTALVSLAATLTRAMTVPPFSYSIQLDVADCTCVFQQTSVEEIQADGWSAWRQTLRISVSSSVTS